MSLKAKQLIESINGGEATLAHRLKLCEEEAVEELVALYSDRMLKTATLILKDSFLAEDIVQESLIDAVTHIQQFRGDASIYSWLYTILIRRCRKQAKRKHWNMLSFMANEEICEVRDTKLNIEDRILAKGRQKQLRHAIGKLSLKYREVIALYYFEELKIQRIAIITNTTLGTVKSRLHRARQKLRTLLDEEGDW